MIKVIALMKRKSGITPEEFARYWFEEHAPLGFDVLPEEIRILGYVQNYTRRTPGDAEPEFDGLVEFCLEDMEAVQKWLAWLTGEGGAVLREDETKFMDSDSFKVLVMEKRVVIPRGGERPR